jgi:hypothetical protein
MGVNNGRQTWHGSGTRRGVGFDTAVTYQLVGSGSNYCLDKGVNQLVSWCQQRPAAYLVGVNPHKFPQSGRRASARRFHKNGTRTSARSCYNGGVRVALQPPNPIIKGKDRPDKGGSFASGPVARTDGVGVDLDQALRNFDQALRNFDQVLRNCHQALRNFDQTLSTPSARLARLDSRCAAIAVRARLFAETGARSALQGVAAKLGIPPSDPLVAQQFANLILKERLALATELGVAPSSHVVSSMLAAASDGDSSLTVLSLALAILAAARERSLAAVHTLALAPAEPPAEGGDQAITARPGAPPGAERTPRQQRVCLTARARATKETGDAGAGLLLPAQGRQATCTGTRRATAV